MNLKFLEDSDELYEYEYKKSELPYFDFEEENNMSSLRIKSSLRFDLGDIEKFI